MLVFVFPGQGSQKKGMGQDLFDSVPEFAAAERQIDEILGYSVRELCLQDPDGRLSDTRYTQPCLFVVNALHGFKALAERGRPAFLAGHSLGEYNALLAAGAFDLVTGVRLVQKRAELMGQAKNGAMAAVIGLDPGKIARVLEENGLDGVDVANYNSPVQTVISGPAPDIQRAKPLFEQAGVDLPPDTEPLAFEGIPELAARLTRNTKDDKTAVFGYGGTVDLTMAQLAHMVAAQGGSLFNDDLSAVDFSSPEAVKAIQYWLDLARANVSYGPTRPNPAGWDGNAYIAGRIALLSMGYWFQGQLAGTPEVAKVSVFLPAPTFAGKRLSPTYYGTGVWIPSKAKNKDAAWRFVEYFIAGEPAKQRAASGWGIPSLKSLEPLMPHKTPEERQVYEVQRRELPYFDIVVVATPYVRPQALAKILSAEFKAAVPSGTSAGKVADSLNRQINDLIAQEKGKVG